MGKCKIIYFIFLYLLVLSCSEKERNFKLATGSPSTSYYKVGDSIARILDNNSWIKFDVIAEYQDGKDTIILNSVDNTKLLSEKKVDFAIAQNDVILERNELKIKDMHLRSVLPLYSEIFFIIYPKEWEPKSLRDLLLNHRVGLGPEGSGTHKLAYHIFRQFGIQPDEFTPVFGRYEQNVLSDSIDVACSVTGFNNARIQKMVKENGRIFSLDDYGMAEEGSSVDGFCLKYPVARPYIIPKNVFGANQKSPILTVAVDAVMLTRDDVDDKVVYELVEKILMNKQLMVFDLNNKLLSHLSECFDPLNLRFPLHTGARHYLDRNQPSFYERYAELFGVIFSILIALITGATTFAKWKKTRNKNRIDHYYEKVLEMQHHIDYFSSMDDCIAAIDELKHMREKAFRLLIDEKLQADESFRIFITFINDVRDEINNRKEELRNEGV